MKTARLVVLTAAVGAGSVCAGLARGSASPARAAEQPQAARPAFSRLDADVVHPMTPARRRSRVVSARTAAGSSMIAAVNTIATRSADQALRDQVGITADRRAQSPTAPK